MATHKKQSITLGKSRAAAQIPFSKVDMGVVFQSMLPDYKDMKFIVLPANGKYSTRAGFAYEQGFYVNFESTSPVRVIGSWELNATIHKDFK